MSYQIRQTALCGLSGLRPTVSFTVLRMANKRQNRLNTTLDKKSLEVLNKTNDDMNPLIIKYYLK